MSRPKNTGKPDPRIVDWAGHRFGRWTAIKISETRTGAGRTKWLCRCDCGNEAEVVTGNLVRGGSQSCGCLIPDSNTARLTKHGHSGRGKGSEYSVWNAMKTRCANPNNRAYHLYGGRGIKVCESWRSSFDNFLRDMGPRPSAEHSIERINSNGNYEPGNCRWATPREQANNTSRNVYFDVRGERLSLAQAVRKYGANYGAVQWRLADGQTIEQALRLS